MYSMYQGLSNDVSDVFLQLLCTHTNLYHSYFEKWLVTGIFSGMFSNEWVIWMFHLNTVSWKLQTSVVIAFWFMKCWLKLLIFIVKIAQNWWKWPKLFCQYFPVDHTYDYTWFRRLLYTPWATSHPNIMAVNRILQTPLAFTQQ